MIDFLKMILKFLKKVILVVRSSAGNKFEFNNTNCWFDDRPRYFSTLRFIKVIGVSLICGVSWFLIGGAGHVIDEKNVVDITAALFFLLVFNIFNALFDVLMICKYLVCPPISYYVF